MDWLTKTYTPDDWLTPDEVDDACVCCQFRKAMYFPSQLCDKCVILKDNTIQPIIKHLKEGYNG